jgi:hypothetical protein
MKDSKVLKVLSLQIDPPNIQVSQNRLLHKNLLLGHGLDTQHGYEDGDLQIVCDSSLLNIDIDILC